MSQSINQSIIALDLAVGEGWNRFLADRRKPRVLGGVGDGTWRRYQAVYRKHMSFCKANGLQYWNEINADNIGQFARLLQKQGLSDRSVILETTVVKAVLKWFHAQRPS